MARFLSVKEALQVAAIVAGIVVASVAAPRLFPLLGNVEKRLVDLRIAALAPREPLHPGIVIVAITEDTLAELRYRSPVDRSFLAGVLRALDQAGARAVGLDILFDQRTDAAKDAELGRVLRAMEAPVVVVWADADDGLTGRQTAFLATYLEGVARASPRFLADPQDGTVRQMDPEMVVAGERIPSLAAALAAAVGASVPEGPIELAYRVAPSHETPPFVVVQAHNVARLPPTLFAGKVVLIGSDLPHSDRFRTPLSAAIGETGGPVSGVLIHAHALAQLMDGRKAPRGSFAVEVALVVALVFVGLAIAALDVPIPLKSGAVLLAATAYWIGAFSLFKYGAVLVPLVAPSQCIVLGAGVGHAYIGRRERRRRRFLRRAFARYVSPAVVDQLLANPARLSLGGERRDVTLIFTDIAGFTSLIERSDPAVILPVLNEYLDGMCRIILEREGTVDKIVGDAVVGFFGAPGDQPDHAARAVHCALALDAFATDYAARPRARGIGFGITRIGVNGGNVAVGNFGGGGVLRLHGPRRCSEHGVAHGERQQASRHPPVRRRDHRGGLSGRRLSPGGKPQAGGQE